MDDKSEYNGGADHNNFLINIVTGSNAEEVLKEPEPYFHGNKKNACLLLVAYLNVFKNLERASLHFTTSPAVVYEHITRQHVMDIMSAYGPYLKDPPTFTFTLTFGNEYHRILRNIALTMKSWK
jgi:hypothetical protein